MALVLIALIVPLASAVVDPDTIARSSSPDHADRPETLAPLKLQIAYVADDQNTRMTGVIRYIDRISNGTATVTLQQVQDDYLVTASSVPLMQTSDEIQKARDQLGRLALDFSDEAKAQMVRFNGSSTNLEATIRVTANVTASIRSNSTASTPWLRSEWARLVVFNQESIDRTKIISELGDQGVNTTQIANISRRIDAQRPVLQSALINRSSIALQTTNAAIKLLNREFRQNVADTRAALAIEMKRDAIMAMG